MALVLHKRMEGMGTGGRKSYSGFKAVAELLNRVDQSASKGILEEIEQERAAACDWNQEFDVYV